jgi:hypothetical protein
MNRDSVENRQYKASSLPVFKGNITVTPDKDALIALYEQICTSWHVLIDIRFKLLGFVPAVSVLLLVNLLSSEGAASGLSTITKIVIAVLGLLATVALLLYDLRNSELHDDLISRGRKIEETWGVDTGQFRGRLKSSNWFVKHDRATALIYGSALVGWAFAILAIVFRI